MVEAFAGELSKATEQRNVCYSKCLEDIFPIAGIQKESKTESKSENTAQPIKEIPGATLEVENNKYYLNYRGLHLPTFKEKNPDGTAAPPYVDEKGNTRVDGMLQPARNGEGKALGVDGYPLHDENGLRRFDKHGNMIATRYEENDPAEMQKNLAKLGNVALTDETRAQYNKMIESSDKLDRIKMAAEIEANEKFVMSHTTAFLWETSYRQTQKQLGQLFNEMSDFRRDLTPVQLSALQQLWDCAATPADIDKWLADPNNKEFKDALTNDKNWPTIRSKFDEFLNKQVELSNKDKELKQKPGLAENVKRMRDGNGVDEEYGRLLSSAADTRQAYLSKLLDQESVKKYISADDNEKEQLENDVNVQECKRVVVELAKINPNLQPRLESTAKKLGIR